MSKRKILIIHETMKGGGAERVLLDLLRHLDYSRHEVTLLLVWATGIYMEQIPDEVKVVHINRDKKHWMERVLFRCKPLLDRWQRRDVNRVLGDEQYDTIVSFMEGPAMVYHSMVTERARRNVTWVHIDLAANRWTLPFHGNAGREQARYGMMDEVVFVSDGARRGFEAVIANDVPHRVVHNPIDRDSIIRRAGERAVDKRRFTVCNVGRLVDQKRQDRIVRAAAILKQRGVEVDWWIAGEGQLEQNLRDLIAQLGVGDCVTLLGYQENPYPAMGAADVFLLTSDSEGYPTVVCEALCLGRPVVSTPVAGVAELIGGGAGVVCDATDDAIADAVQRLVEDRELLHQLALASSLRGAGFSIRATVGEIEAIL